MGHLLVSIVRATYPACMKRFIANLFLVLLPVAQAFAADHPAKVVGISDGDTITVLTAEKKQVKIRLHEIAHEGMAWWYAKYAPNDRELSRLETEARTAHRGLWSQPNPVPPWDWRKGVGVPATDEVVGNRKSHVYHKLYFPGFYYARYRGFSRDFETFVDFCLPATPPAEGINAQHPQIPRHFR
jgi:hypothetical protein